jgi:hypothetical protein
MLLRYGWAGLLLLTLPAAAQDAPASSPVSAPASATASTPASTTASTPATPTASAPAPAYSRNTPVEKMTSDPAAVAVLNKDLPGLLTAPEFAIFKSMSLKQLQQASGGDLSEVDVAKAEADLQALPTH